MVAKYNPPQSGLYEDESVRISGTGKPIFGNTCYVHDDLDGTSDDPTSCSPLARNFFSPRRDKRKHSWRRLTVIQGVRSVCEVMRGSINSLLSSACVATICRTSDSGHLDNRSVVHWEVDRSCNEAILMGGFMQGQCLLPVRSGRQRDQGTGPSR